MPALQVAKSLTVLGSVLAILFSTISASAEIGCKQVKRAEGIHPAPLQLFCDSASWTGFVKSQVQPTALKVAVFNPSTGKATAYEFPNPPGNVNNYRGSLADDAWIVEMLKKSGATVTSSTKIDLVELKFADKLELFADPAATQPLPRPKPSTALSGGSAAGAPAAPASASASAPTQRCGYANKPALIKTASCGSRQICFAYATCFTGEKLDGHFLPVSCFADERGACLSATECAGKRDVWTDAVKAPVPVTPSDVPADKVKLVK